MSQENIHNYNPYGQNVSYLTAGELNYAHDVVLHQLTNCPRHARAELQRKLKTVESEMKRRGIKVPK